MGNPRNLQELRDAALETEISLAYLRFTSTGANTDLTEMNRLIAQRSPDQVRRMEREKGLAR